MITPLDAAALRAALSATAWRPIVITPRTGSTNADLLAGLRAGTVTTGAVEVAAEQDSGRGRLDRAWSSPAGRSVALSAVVAPARDRAWTVLPLLAGLAVAEAASAWGAAATVKWPNDVLIGGLKCCGILVETALTPAGLRAVVGIGLNVSQTRDELPTATATSLALAGLTVSREQAAAVVLERLERVVRDWRAGADVMGRYRARSATLGQTVRLTIAADHVVEGEARAVAADGRLGVVSAGSLRWFAAGDVQHLRATP